jgi:hypothetical protein
LFHFGVRNLLHPAVFLLGWFILLLTAQFLAMSTMLCLLLLLCIERQSLRRWKQYLLRSRWLLLTISLVISYSQPGLLFMDLAWAPSHEGMRAAVQHLLALVLVLGGLALVMTRLSRADLVLAIHALLRFLLPSAWVERSVGRLALVFEYLEESPQPREWKTLLAEVPVPEMRHISLRRLPWRFVDTLSVLALASLGVLLGMLQ